MDERKNKKLCRFGINCNKKQSCKYFHQGQQLDDASLSMKHDQIRKQTNMLSSNQNDQHNYTQKRENHNRENHQYQGRHYENRHNYERNHCHYRGYHGGHHRGHHGGQHHGGHHQSHHYDRHQSQHHDRHQSDHDLYKIRQNCIFDHFQYTNNKLNQVQKANNQSKSQRNLNQCTQNQFNTKRRYRQKRQKSSSQSENQRSQNSRNSQQPRQASLSGDTKRKLKKQQDYTKFKQKTEQDEQIYQSYYKACASFFNNRIFNQNKRAKIVQYLIVYAPLSIVQDVILASIIQLQKQGFINHFNYKKMIKMFCKKDYDIQETRKVLLKKLDIQSKRIEKDKDFHIKFPNPKNFDFLQSQDLLTSQLQDQNIIYLIDGNNCLTTQKHIRSFFQSKQSKKKTQAQCRFRWLLSLTLNPEKVFLFFDEEYLQENYELFKKTILHEIQYQQYEKINIIFPKDNQNADKAILKKLKELKTKNIFLQKIVLITGDRVLTQQCLDIYPIKKSSGLYFIKFLKKVLKSKLQKQVSKKILKRIFNYGD